MVKKKESQLTEIKEIHRRKWIKQRKKEKNLTSKSSSKSKTRSKKRCCHDYDVKLILSHGCIQIPFKLDNHMNILKPKTKFLVPKDTYIIYLIRPGYEYHISYYLEDKLKNFYKKGNSLFKKNDKSKQLTKEGKKLQEYFRHFEFPHGLPSEPGWKRKVIKPGFGEFVSGKHVHLSKPNSKQQLERVIRYKGNYEVVTSKMPIFFKNNLPGDRINNTMLEFNSHWKTDYKSIECINPSHWKTNCQKTRPKIISLNKLIDIEGPGIYILSCCRNLCDGLTDKEKKLIFETENIEIVKVKEN